MYDKLLSLSQSLEQCSRAARELAEECGAKPPSREWEMPVIAQRVRSYCEKYTKALMGDVRALMYDDVFDKAAMCRSAEESICELGAQLCGYLDELVGAAKVPESPDSGAVRG